MEICTIQVYTSHRHATFCNRYRMITTRALTERKPPPTPKFQAKVIRDSNTDFRIDPDTDVCRICSNMLWMHRLLGVNHFAKYGTKRPLIVWEMLTNDQKSPIPKWWKNEKKWSRIQAQIRITTKSQPLPEGHPLPVPDKFGRRPFRHSSVSCLQNDRTNDRQNDHITSAWLTAVTRKSAVRGTASIPPPNVHILVFSLFSK